MRSREVEEKLPEILSRESPLWPDGSRKVNPSPLPFSPKELSECGGPGSAYLPRGAGDWHGLVCNMFNICASAVKSAYRSRAVLHRAVKGVGGPSPAGWELIYRWQFRSPAHIRTLEIHGRAVAEARSLGSRYVFQRQELEFVRVRFKYGHRRLHPPPELVLNVGWREVLGGRWGKACAGGLAGQ